MRRRWPACAVGRAIVGSAESRSIHSGGGWEEGIERGGKGDTLARSLLSRAGSSREKFSRRRVVARVRGQDRAFRGVRGVGGGSPESVPRVGSQCGMSSQRCWRARVEKRGGLGAVRRSAARGGGGMWNERCRALRALRRGYRGGVRGRSEVAVVVAVGG